MRPLNKLILAFFSCVLLTGCWDKVELENRGFVISLGIDKYAKDKDVGIMSNDRSNFNRFNVSMALADMAKLGSKDAARDDSKPKAVKIAGSETISSGMNLIDSYSSKKNYFGITKDVIFSADILKDEDLFREAIDAIERDTELSRKVIVLATKEKASKVLASKATGEPLVGLFVTNFYRNNYKSLSLAFKMDLQELLQQLHMSGTAVIPQISIESDAAKLGGAAVVKDFKLQGFLNDIETRGYLWVKNKVLGSEVNVAYDNTFIPLNIKKNKTKVTFGEENGNLTCTIDVKAEANIDEYVFEKESLFKDNKLPEIEGLCDAEIKKEILDIANLFQQKYKADAFGFNETVKKKNYDLWQKYNDNWEQSFEKMQFNVTVNAKIKRIGVIK